MILAATESIMKIDAIPMTNNPNIIKNKMTNGLNDSDEFFSNADVDVPKTDLSGAFISSPKSYFTDDRDPAVVFDPDKELIKD